MQPSITIGVAVAMMSIVSSAWAAGDATHGQELYEIGASPVIPWIRAASGRRTRVSSGDVRAGPLATTTLRH